MRQKYIHSRQCIHLRTHGGFLSGMSVSWYKSWFNSLQPEAIVRIEKGEKPYENLRTAVSGL